MVCTETRDTSLGGAAMGADLGGSSKYSKCYENIVEKVENAGNQPCALNLICHLTLNMDKSTFCRYIKRQIDISTF